MRPALAALPLLVLADCSSEPEPAPSPTPSATMAAERTLVASGFDRAMLGARIEGPEGSEVEAEVAAGGKTIGTVTSYVACPARTATCDPATMPEGTIYTYVHRIALALPPSPTPAPTPLPTASGTTEPAAPPVAEIGPTFFRMTRPAPGFNLSVGYDMEQAEAALGDPDALTVKLDQNQIVWRVTGGSGWKPGATITVWWQSSEPPAGPQRAYQLQVSGQPGTARGPFPAEENSAAP